MYTYTPVNSRNDDPITNLLSILCILIEIFSRAHARARARGVCVCVCVCVWGGGGGLMI